jgi:hypothetical protein
MKLNKVKVTKVETLPGGVIGQSPSGYITDGYYVIGDEVNKPTLGNHYVVFRSERNDVKIDGVFSTSPVKNINILDNSATVITTQNSIYLIENL